MSATDAPARAKFSDPYRTARGETRAWVAPDRLHTLWFNTGTLCNLTCRTCYIESSPRNDRLVYLSAAEVATYLDEAVREDLGTELVGFTGGEPFLNPALPAMLEAVLARGLRALVLTNAMRPMRKMEAALRDLRRYGERLVIRVSLDHYTRAVHEAERGARSFAPTLAGLRWLAAQGFRVHVAARRLTDEPEDSLRAGFAALFAELGVPVDAQDPVAMTLFPQMDETADVPEITTACWEILGRAPSEVMCASSRMVVTRRGAAMPVVAACTLLPYDARFELGATLREAMRPVPLNHPHCARFCVLGGAACSRG
ncbi:MAG: radical SAM protein [Alphaproteobacteria bacterium]|nr:radical SAM protein [Alphaproteobacteria bacterium]